MAKNRVEKKVPHIFTYWVMSYMPCQFDKFDNNIKKQGNPDVSPTDPASTANTALLFLGICFFCNAVSTKFLLLRKSLYCF